MALARCPCAFRLRRLAQTVGLSSGCSGARHFSLKFSHRIALVRCPCALRLLRLAQKVGPSSGPWHFSCKIHNITSYFINIDMCHVPRNALVFPDPHQVCVRYMEDWPLALPPVEDRNGKGWRESRCHQNPTWQKMRGMRKTMKNHRNQHCNSMS